MPVVTEEQGFGNRALREIRNVDVPPDVRRIEEHAPCFRCGAAGSCKHRPWLIEAFNFR